MTTTTVRARQKDITGYRSVVRGTRWGNPYTLLEHGGDYTRRQSMYLYRLWLQERFDTDPDFRTATLKLYGERLGCTCGDEYRLAEPPLCHSAVLARFIDEQMQLLQDKEI